MRKTARTPAGEFLTGIFLDLFQLNSGLLTAGDRLVAGLGLTSARWQMLGAVAAAERPQLVSKRLFPMQRSARPPPAIFLTPPVRRHAARASL